MRHGSSVPAFAAFRPFALLGIAASVLITEADLDLWGHLRFGLDMIATGRLSPADDPCSFTQDRA